MLCQPPMKTRKDALVGAAKMITLVNDIGLKHAPLTCSTVGLIQSVPNSRNVIPGQVFFTIDIRHPDDATLSAMDKELREGCAAIIASQGLTMELEQIWYSPPVPFNLSCVESVRQAALNLGYSHCDIVSGAGHDACYISRVAPTAMMFVPCKDGFSHNELEDAKQEHLTARCNVLFKAVLNQAM
jgi:N-carbamoyl-L-amino-acid hydrolase